MFKVFGVVSAMTSNEPFSERSDENRGDWEFRRSNQTDRAVGPTVGPIAEIVRIGVCDRIQAVSAGIVAHLSQHDRLEVIPTRYDFIAKVNSGLVETAEFSVLVMDPLQFGASWPMALDVIQAADPELRLVAYSLDATSTFADRLIECGASAVVDKQEPVGTLLLAVQSVLTGSLFVSRGLHHDSTVALSERESEVLALMGRGLQLKSVAHQMGITRQSAHAYKQRAKTKLGVRTDLELIQEAVARGLVPSNTLGSL